MLYTVVHTLTQFASLSGGRKELELASGKTAVGKVVCIEKASKMFCFRNPKLGLTAPGALEFQR